MTLPPTADSRRRAIDKRMREIQKQIEAARKQRDEDLATAVREMFPLLEPAEQVRAAHAEMDLYEFVKQAWPHVESEEFVDGQHIRQICIHLQKFSIGEIPNLAANIPPRYCKSTLFSVMFPAWEWAQLAGLQCFGPRESYLSFAYREDLALRDNWRARRLMQSPWYQARWGRRWKFSGDQNVKSRYANNQGGQRVSASMGSAVGEGGSRIVLDDPQSYEEALKRESSDKVIRFYLGQLSMRGFGLRTRKALIMQRLSQRDLMEYIMAANARGEEDWVFLVFPIVYIPERTCTTWRGRNERGDWQIANKPKPNWTDVERFGGDWRTVAGQSLWPELYGGEERAQVELEKLRKRTPDDVWSAQGLQQPIPSGGATFKSVTWFPLYDNLPNYADLPEHLYPIIFSTWDCAVKDKESNDPTCGWLVAYYPHIQTYYVLDRHWGRWDFVAQEHRMLQVASNLARDGAAHIVEGGGNGSGLVAACNNKIPALLQVQGMEPDPSDLYRNRFVEWLPRGMSKQGRASIVSPRFRERKVLFPRWAYDPLDEGVHPQTGAARWRGDGDPRWYWHAIDEFLSFPAGGHDDQVDALGQGIIWMETVGLEMLLDRGDYHAGRPGPIDMTLAELNLPDFSGHSGALSAARDLSKIWSPLSGGY